MEVQRSGPSGRRSLGWPGGARTPTVPSYAESWMDCGQVAFRAADSGISGIAYQVSRSRYCGRPEGASDTGSQDFDHEFRDRVRRLRPMARTASVASAAGVGALFLRDISCVRRARADGERRPRGRYITTDISADSAGIRSRNRRGQRNGRPRARGRPSRQDRSVTERSCSWLPTWRRCTRRSYRR